MSNFEIEAAYKTIPFRFLFNKLFHRYSNRFWIVVMWPFLSVLRYRNTLRVSWSRHELHYWKKLTSLLETVVELVGGRHRHRRRARSPPSMSTTTKQKSLEQRLYTLHPSNTSIPPISSPPPSPPSNQTEASFSSLYWTALRSGSSYSTLTQSADWKSADEKLVIGVKFTHITRFSPNSVRCCHVRSNFILSNYRTYSSPDPNNVHGHLLERIWRFSPQRRGQWSGILVTPSGKLRREDTSGTRRGRAQNSGSYFLVRPSATLSLSFGCEQFFF